MKPKTPGADALEEGVLALVAVAVADGHRRTATTFLSVVSVAWTELVPRTGSYRTLRHVPKQ